MSEQKTVVLVTGANTGLGFQVVRSLCASDKAYEILVGGRSLVKAQQAAKAAIEDSPSTKSRTWPIQVDIEDDDSMKGASVEVETKFGRLDALINNAGMSPGELHDEMGLLLSLKGGQFDPQFTAGKLTMRQMWNLSWNVNTVGTQIMTTTFIPLLLESNDPRLLFITSGTSTLSGTDNLDHPLNKSPAKGWPKSGQPEAFNVPAYRSAKCGMNMMMREWYRVLKEDGVKVWAISPGQLATGLGGHSIEASKSAGGGDPALAGDFIKTVVEGARDADVGKVVMRNGGLQAW